MAALLAGQAVAEISRTFSLRESTIRSWRDQMAESEPGQFAEIRERKKEEIGELLLYYLRENIKSMALQVRHFGNPDWLAKQPASELAVLHGICCDKAIRLMEAAEAPLPVTVTEEDLPSAANGSSS